MTSTALATPPLTYSDCCPDGPVPAAGSRGLLPGTAGAHWTFQNLCFLVFLLQHFSSERPHFKCSRAVYGLCVPYWTVQMWTLRWESCERMHQGFCFVL